LNWPFIFDERLANFEMDGLEEEYWKMVVKQPGKARHGGFHLAVMACFGMKWAQLMYDIIKASLIMGYTPDRFWVGTRIPIPKPTPGETRPLTLLHGAETADNFDKRRSHHPRDGGFSKGLRLR
jgi:hypothetical protein